MPDLQSPQGKKEDNPSLTTPKGEAKDLIINAIEPKAIPDSQDLEPVDTIIIKDGESYRQMKVYSVKAMENIKKIPKQIAIESIDCEFCEGKGKVIVEKRGIKECPRCDGEGSVESNEPNQQQISTDIQQDIQQDVQQDVQQEQPVEELEEQPVEEPLKHPDSKLDFSKLGKRLNGFDKSEENIAIEKEQWVTMSGNHILVKDGQTK